MKALKAAVILIGVSVIAAITAMYMDARSGLHDADTRGNKLQQEAIERARK